MSSHSIPLPYKDQPKQTPIVNLYEAFELSKNIAYNDLQPILNKSKREKLKSLIEDVLLEQKKADQSETDSKNEKFINDNLFLKRKNNIKCSSLPSICKKEIESNSGSIAKNRIISLVKNPLLKSNDTNTSLNQDNINSTITFTNINSSNEESKIENMKNNINLKRILNEDEKYNKKYSNISDLKREMIDLLNKGPKQICKETSLEELNEKDNYLTKKIDKNIIYLQKFISLDRLDTNKSNNSNDQLTNLIQIESDINLTSHSKYLPKKLVRKLPVSSHQTQIIFNPTISNIVKLDHLNDTNLNINSSPKKKLNLYSSLNYNNLKLLEKDSLEKQIEINQNPSDKKDSSQTEELNCLSDNRLKSLIKKSSKLINTDKIIIKKTHEESDYKFGQNKSKFTCTECGIKVKKLAALKKHLLSHTNLKPYNCRICHSKFTTKGNLVKHLKTKAHVNRCICSGMNENDEKISKITNENIDHSALNVQLEIKNKIRISRQ